MAKSKKNNSNTKKTWNGIIMRCISPVSVKHPHSINGKRMTVPCGKCLYCYNNRRAGWTVRLLEELKQCNTAIFTTITYNDQSLKYKNVKGKEIMELDKEGIRAFIKRLKIKVDRYYQSKSESSLDKAKRQRIKYYLVGEYGPKSLRPHYHAIFFNLPKQAEKWLKDTWSKREKELGFVHVGEVTQASIHYTTKYILDALLTTQHFSELKNSKGEWLVTRPFSIISNGIGEKYVNKNKDYHRNNNVPFYTLPGGIKQTLPRYYKDKMFNENQKKAFAEEAETEGWKREKIKKEKGIKEYDEYQTIVKNTLKKSKQRKI